MLVFKDYIPKLLPEYYRENDSYNSGGKGFLERFLEIFGEELDEQYYSKIDGVLQLHDVWTTPVGYLEYLAYLLGDLPSVIVTDEHDYRNLLSYILSIYKIKGTATSFESMLHLVGVDTTLNEIAIGGIAYDAGFTYDEDGVIYDEQCIPCSNYELILTNGATLTADLYNQIKDIVFLLEPVNANLSRLNYNGDDVTESLIEVTVDGNGDLIYNNAADPGLTLELDAAGNLIIGGPNANRYYIDGDGNLIYVLY